MSVRLYMDHHVRKEVTEGLRVRGVDVLTAEEDGTKRLPDPELLDRATELGRVLFTQDQHLLKEAARPQEVGTGSVVSCMRTKSASRSGSVSATWN